MVDKFYADEFDSDDIQLFIKFEKFCGRRYDALAKDLINGKNVTYTISDNNIWAKATDHKVI